MTSIGHFGASDDQHQDQEFCLGNMAVEAVEASLCYFFEKRLMKLKCPGIYRYLHYNLNVVFSWPTRSSKSVNMS